LDRKCNKATTLTDENGHKVNIRPGDGFWIPVIHLHMNPNYFPNPTEFIPERFAAEEKLVIDPGTYLNFGIGPRNCIGSRFALMQSKAIIFHLLSNFRFEISPQTQHPFKVKNRSLGMIPSKGFWLNLRILDQ
jgi:cytochrome P450